MSDQIKTQHGTIGPIMAECEQLRRDLAQARDENARLTGQLQDAHADLNAVKCGHATPKEARLERELAQANARQHQSDLNYDALERQNKNLLTEQTHEESVRGQLLDELAHAKSELAQAKAENARLAAVNAAMRYVCEEVISPLRPRWRHTMELAAKAVAINPETALRDLLAPTIELLESHYGQGHVEHSDVSKELDRLRSILTSGAKSDTNSP